MSVTGNKIITYIHEFIHPNVLFHWNPPVEGPVSLDQVRGALKHDTPDSIPADAIEIDVGYPINGELY